MKTPKVSHFFWPPVIDGDYLDAARRRCLLLLCLVAAGAGLFSGIQNFAISWNTYPLQTLISVIAPLAFLACPLLIAATNNVRIVAMFYLVLTFIAMVSVAFIAGGMFSRSTLFMLPWAILTALFLGWREGIVAAVMVFGAYIALFLNQAMIAPSVYDLNTYAISEWLFVGLTLSLIVMATGAIVFQREMEIAALKLADSIKQAEAANKAKSDFLATMSHEIRTPMNGVMGMAELLEETELDARQSVYVETISSSATSLLSIINDILDISKIEAGGLTLHDEAFAVRDIVDQVKTLFVPRCRQKGLELALTFEGEFPEAVLADRNRLRQILINLVGNAVKFTHQGEVYLRVGSQLQGDRAALTFTVKDTGIGIPADKLALIFEKFEQGEASTTRRFDGSGLGLAIARDLARAMGGDIMVQSAPADGSIFTLSLSLPVTTLENDVYDDGDDDGIAFEIIDGGASEAVATNFTRILVAEDNEVNQLVLKHMLTPPRYELTFATNGREALDLFKSGEFDAILMDVSMPEMDGFQATGKIRAHEAAHDLARTPIICLTAHAHHGKREESLDAGMDDYLSKPMRKGDVEEKIAKWVSKADEKAAALL